MGSKLITTFAKLMAIGLSQFVAVGVHAEKFMRYDKDPSTVTIFHMAACSLNMRTTSKQVAHQAAVFSRATNATLKKGCWRYEDDTLYVLLKLEDGKEFTFSPSELQQGERF